MAREADTRVLEFALRTAMTHWITQRFAGAAQGKRLRGFRDEDFGPALLVRCDIDSFAQRERRRYSEELDCDVCRSDAREQNACTRTVSSASESQSKKSMLWVSRPVRQDSSTGGSLPLLPCAFSRF